jgi:energy-coupling factor transporter ATP-binding protein EcfA2
MNTTQVTPNPIHSIKNGAGLNLDERIEQIIQKRQSLARKAQPVHAHLESLLQKVLQLSQHYQTFSSSLAAIDARDTLEQINLMQMESQIRAERDRLDNLITRLSRPTLNIGVVGRMGQGKSTFLQRLSGLTDDEIPARKGGACTAVRSKIYHHEGETKASVTFHSEDSFLQEVIRPYYEALGFANPPANLDVFASAALPMEPTGATLQTMYGHLKDDYQQNLRQYRDFLKDSASRTISIPKEQIPTYVVQRRDTHGHLTTFNHLAVREVNIQCHFKQYGVNKLGLVDVPGLGDTRLGDSKLILETLGREVDAVLFLRRPDSLRYQWDQDDLDLYDLAAEALPNLAARSFMLMNRQIIDGDNIEACEVMQRDLGKMKVVECLIANCDDPQKANGMLDQVLEYLDREILTLEEQYAQACQTNLLTLHEALDKNLGRVHSMSSTAEQEHQLFEERFEQFMQDLSNGLRDLVEELEQEKGQDDADFQRAVRKVLADYERNAGIPSAEEIKNRRRLPICHDSYKATYCMCVAELKANLSQHFSTLNDGLQQAANKLKVRVARTLHEQTDLGGLASVQGTDFLIEMTDLLTAQSNSLQTGFQQMVNFNVSCSELIRVEIQEDLGKILDPDDVIRRHELAEMSARAVSAIGDVSMTVGGATLNLSPELLERAVGAVEHLATVVTDAFFELTDETIHEKLKVLNLQAMRQCEQTLQRWLSKPSGIRYAKATEFVDLVLDDKGVQTAWKLFLRKPSIRNKVWKEFAEFERLQELQMAWLDAVQAVQNSNQRQKLEFLHYR